MGPTPPMVDADGVVRIGSVVFALIRPHSGSERAFNHWYERDHYYTTGVAAPGVFSAGRFIEPREGLHLALYFVLPGHEAARIAFATEQVKIAAADNRMFTEREHLHTWSYSVVGAEGAGGGVPAALALDHGFAAISVALFDDPGPSFVPPTLSVAAVTLTLRPSARIMDSTWDAGFDPLNGRTVLTFHSDVPAAEPGPPAPDRAGPSARWSATFTPMVFGTDTHVVG